MPWPETAVRARIKARQARQARHDEMVRPILKDVQRHGLGLAAAVEALEREGVRPPGGSGGWSRTAVWRIAQRLGISLSTPGVGIGRRWNNDEDRTGPVP